MTKDETLKLALEALEVANSCVDGYYIPKGKTHLPEIELAITAIKEVLANEALEKMAENARELGLDYEPKQEPVAWVDLLKEAQQIVESKVLWKRFIDGTPLSNDIACWMAAFAQQHTTPPQRTWVGLTDEELQPIADEYRILFGSWVKDFARAIEAKLRSKNSG